MRRSGRSTGSAVVRQLRRTDGVLSARELARTGRSIAAMQEPSGAIPWFPGGHTDPWDHVESAMALTATGLREEARAAFTWLAETQRADGSWPMKSRRGAIECPDTDSNFCTYIAVGLWHHQLVTGDTALTKALWPTVRAAVEVALTMQDAAGHVYWGRGAGGVADEALITGCSSIFHAFGCALRLAEAVGDPQPEWEVARYQLGHALRRHPELFTPKPEYSMDWYYPVLSGALRGPAATERVDERWTDFVVDGLGIRCVDHRPWVTGAETCELALALEAIGDRERARRLLAWMQHLRDGDGSYWTGLVYSDGKRWPVELSSWTSAAVVLASDALSRTTAGNGIFRDAAAPIGIPDAGDRCGAHCQVSGSPV